MGTLKKVVRNMALLHLFLEMSRVLLWVRRPVYGMKDLFLGNPNYSLLEACVSGRQGWDCLTLSCVPVDVDVADKLPPGYGSTLFLTLPLYVSL